MNQMNMNNSFIQIISIICILLIVTGIMYGISKLTEYMFYSKNNSPWILEGSVNGKNSKQIIQDPKNENSITLYRSDNQEGGAVFSYSFWFVIDNMQYKYGEWKHMFHKGNKSANPNRAPGVWIHPDKNSLRIYMNTYNKIYEYLDIDNIPIKRWVHCVILLNGMYLDVYINGQLKTRKKLDGMPKQNFGDLWLSLYGGFDGYISNMRYFRKALKYYEIENITKNGPSNQECLDSGNLPPYLNDDWWYDF
jgi:hypothetical protein